MRVSVIVRFLLVFVAAVPSCKSDDPELADAGSDMAVVSSMEDAAVADAAPIEDGASVDAAACLPDLLTTIACGRCGAAVLACIDGKVTTSACMGEKGVCAPGESYVSTNGCQIRVCGKDCEWEPWALKPGAQCFAPRSCDAGPSCPRAGTQQCLSTCKWGPCQCL